MKSNVEVVDVVVAFQEGSNQRRLADAGFALDHDVTAAKPTIREKPIEGIEDEFAPDEMFGSLVDQCPELRADARGETFGRLGPKY